MSFSIEFTALNSDDARRIVGEDAGLPMEVRSFLARAIMAQGTDVPIYVKAMGHLALRPGDYLPCTATIEVRSLIMLAPAKADVVDVAAPESGQV